MHFSYVHAPVLNKMACVAALQREEKNALFQVFASRNLISSSRQMTECACAEIEAPKPSRNSALYFFLHRL